MQYGPLLKKSRKQSGLSQEELSEKTSIARSTISKIENGLMELKLSDAVKWFQAIQAPEALVAILCGVDVATVIQTLPTFMGGFIYYI